MSTENQLVRITEKSVAPLLAGKEADFIRLIGKDNMIRETSFAIQAANSNSMLAEATPQSVAKAVWNVAISGLSLNPVLKMAYLIPKRISGTVEAVLMPSYQGLSKLITDTGAVVNVYAHCIYKGDVFDVQYGTETKLVHSPKFMTSKKEDVTHSYAVAVLHNGSKVFEVMGIDQIHDIRERSDGWKSFKGGKTTSCIWETDFAEMSRKTVIKRLVKYLPKTDVRAWEKVMQAIEMDNAEYPISIGQENYIRSLLSTSTLDERQIGFIERRLGADMAQGEAEKIISDLKLNQLAGVDLPNISASAISQHISDVTSGD